jgi:hypothetical protein
MFGNVPTGLADPVYAEAYVTVHQYDIVLDVTVINRTEGTMQVRGQLTYRRKCHNWTLLRSMVCQGRTH